MKEINELKLFKLSDVKLENREMSQLYAGKSCGCGCHGSSSNNDNYSANWYSGFTKSTGGEIRCASTGDEYSGDDLNQMMSYFTLHQAYVMLNAL